RAHSFSYPADAQWVRLNVSKLTAGSGGLALDEIDIHDVSNGSQDTWLFFGDSITAFAYDRNTPADQPSFAEVIHAAHPSYFPAMIDAGIGSELSVDGNGRLQQLFDLNPDYHFVALGYGTNDSWGAGKDPAGFTVTMQGLIDKIKASGRVPVLARIPYAPIMPDHEAIPAFNTALDGLTTKNTLSTEADLYTFFFNNPQDLMTDMVHPLPAGRIGMNQVWAAACDSAYAP
ncbi:MAG TPA: GDSL-type esterase/lipase family protein, partial [Polyangiaceae bacterium]